MKVPFRGKVSDPRPRLESAAPGVGNTLMVCASFAFSGCTAKSPTSFQSQALGVGSNDEDPFPLMGGADVGRS